MTSNPDTTVTWLTQEAFDRLTAELNSLIEHRPAMAAEINARREEGDLKENGGYHAAREEQGKQEARIAALTQLLRTAQIGQAPGSEDGSAGPGKVVVIRWDGDADDETETFLLGSRLSKTADLDALSLDTPLGSAIEGHHPGDEIAYTAPNGKQLKLVLVEVRDYTG